MRSGQGEAGAGVVEFAVGPKHRIVATLASGREMGRHVIHRRSGLVVIGLVATHASGRGDVVIVVDVTIGALTRRHRVAPVSGNPVLVWSNLPSVQSTVSWHCSQVGGKFAVTWFTGLMCRVVVLLVAADARRAGDVVVVVDVAVGTLPRRNGVRAGQREPGGVVVERCIQPTAGVVTLLAGLREVRSARDSDSSCPGSPSGGRTRRSCWSGCSCC